VHQRSAQSIRREALFSEQPKPLFYSAESANSKKIINFAARLLPPVSSGVLQNLIKFSASTSAQTHREINVFPSLAQSYKFFPQNARDDHFALFGKFPTLSAHSQPVLIKFSQHVNLRANLSYFCSFSSAAFFTNRCMSGVGFCSLGMYKQSLLFVFRNESSKQIQLSFWHTDWWQKVRIVL
jgi:hypothetical protein